MSKIKSRNSKNMKKNGRNQQLSRIKEGKLKKEKRKKILLLLLTIDSAK